MIAIGPSTFAAVSWTEGDRRKPRKPCYRVIPRRVAQIHPVSRAVTPTPGSQLGVDKLWCRTSKIMCNVCVVRQTDPGRTASTHYPRFELPWNKSRRKDFTIDLHVVYSSLLHSEPSYLCRNECTKGCGSPETTLTGNHTMYDELNRHVVLHPPDPFPQQGPL